MGLFHLGKGIVMLQRHAAGLAAAAVLAIVPAAAFAGVYKCVGANGATTFSDKPCQLNGDLKQADIASDSALTNAMTRDRDRSIGESCSDMADRSRHCGISINRTIYTHFQESCYGPQHRYEIERDKLAAQQRRGQPIDWDHDPRYHQKTGAELKCGVLVTDMWQFVKENFQKDLTEQEIKAVDYQVQATETNPNQPTTPGLNSTKKTTVVIIRTSQ
jgi:hypothetical protein